MLINSIMFYITSIFIIIGCILTITSKKIMHSILYALIVFFFIGLLFFSLHAPFIGAIQISIYGIALCILFTIAINLTNYKEENKKIKHSHRLFLSILGLFLISSSIIAILNASRNYDYIFSKFLNNFHQMTPIDTTAGLSAELLFKNLIAFELLGIYILIALIGISVLFVFKGEE